MAITNGKYPMRAVGQVVLGTSSEKKTPFIELYLSIESGDNKGGQVRWTGYFGPNSAERTIEALQTMGWEGEDLSEFADGALHGLDKNLVQGVVEIEEYEAPNKETGEPEKRSTPKVQFINKLGGYLNVQNAMPKAEAETFAEKMKGLVLKSKMRKGAPLVGSGDSFDFGENVEQPKATGTGGKKGF